jgi:hypothetical protein
MRLRNPLHAQRLFPAALSVFLLLSLVSCSSQKEIRASIDASNEHEGGDSKIYNNNDYGWNLAMCMFLARPSSVSNAAAGDDAVPAAGWLLGPQFEIVQKGSKLDGSKTTLTYINAIGDVLYQYPLEGKGTLYGGAGPYIGYGLAGHVKGAGFKEPAFGSDGYRRFDAGLHLTAGYRLPIGLSFTFGYEYGLINKSRFDDFTSRNRTASLQIGYSLDKIISGLKKK